MSLSRFLYPLDEFYAQANRGLPAVELVSGEDVPEPYKSLLLHSNDMTPALEKYHGETLHLKILNRQQRDDAYFREVVLATDETGNPVEDGAIKINLLLFPPNARLQILQERLPLGHILAELKILHRSRPEVYLKVTSDPFIDSALGLPPSSTVYGRRNVLLDPDQRSLAEVVEILPLSLDQQ